MVFLSFSFARLKVSVAIVLSTEALFVFGAMVAINHCVAIHLVSAGLLGIGLHIIKMIIMMKTLTVSKFIFLPLGSL